MPPSNPKPTLAQQVEGLYNAIPVTGEIEYTALADKVRAEGNGDALGQIQQLKYAKRIKIRVESNPDTFKATSYVSRA